jgi:putative Holliday junction resolvase
MRRGIRIALDLGASRVGIAKCDPDAILASPLEVCRPDELSGRLASLIQELDPIEILIGLPIDLKGEIGLAATKALEIARKLVLENQKTVFRVVDERLTTRVARGQLQDSGYTTRNDKALIDAVAASVLLEDALEFERQSGKEPGQVLQ